MLFVILKRRIFMQISKVAKAVSTYIEKYGRTPEFKIQNKPVKQMVLKEDDIYKVALSNGEIIYPAGKHPFMIDDEQVILNDCPTGTVLYNGISIVSKEFIKNDIVFDFELDTKDRTYFLAGVKHHNTKVFNGIRSLMLDKKVGPEDLPKDIMIVCAMNPKDTGAIALSDHFKDVVDVISAEADFNDFIKYMKGKKSLLDMNEKIGFDLLSIIVDMHQQITALFESETDTEDEELNDFNSRKYYWGADNVNIFYVSPREMDDMISGSVTNSVNGLVLFESFDKNNKYNQDDLQRFTDYIIDKTSEKYKEILDFVANDKGNIDPDSFSKLMLGVGGKLEETAPKIFNEFNTIKSLATVTIKSVFENVDYNIDTLLNEPTIKPTFENILDSADVDEIKLDFMSVIDDMIKKNTPIELIENLIKMWKLLEMVDWTKFNSEITSNLSIIFVKRGYQPTLNKIVDEGNDETFKKLDEIMDKYSEEIEYITSRASGNIYNMFVKSKS